MATVGDPLSDLGYLLSTYPEGPDDQGALLSLAGGVARGAFPGHEELLSFSLSRRAVTSPISTAGSDWRSGAPPSGWRASTGVPWKE
jgi:aminoglycoside phosphotransferase (APT) family kinase protein